MTYEFPLLSLGRVDVAGTGLGYNPCGYVSLNEPEETETVYLDGRSAGPVTTYSCEPGASNGFSRSFSLWEAWVGDKTVDPPFDPPIVPVVDGLVLEPGSTAPDVFTHGLRRESQQFASRVESDGTVLWDNIGGAFVASEFVDVYPRRHLMAVDAGTGELYIATEARGPGANGRDVWIAEISPANGNVVWAEFVHLPTRDGEDFVAGIAAHDEHVFIGGNAVSADGTWQAFAYAYDNTGGERDFAVGPAMNDAMQVRDVALDAERARYYIAGESLSLGGAGIAIGFDVSDPDNITLDYTDPFPPALFVGADIHDIALDGRGDVYIGGIAPVTGADVYMFVARHDISNVVGKTYVTTYSGHVHSTPIFGQLAVNSGGLAYVTGTAINVDGSGRDIVTWRVDPTADVRWATIIQCPRDLQTADALIVREEDQTVPVAASMEAEGWCDEDPIPGYVRPCTHVLQLNAADGAVLRSRVATPYGTERLRQPRLITHADTTERVYTISVATWDESGNQQLHRAFVDAYHIPVEDVLDIGQGGALGAASIRARARATSTGFRLTLDGLAGAGAAIRVFDVTGRALHVARLMPGVTTLAVDGPSSGVYFIDARTGDGRRARLRTVVLE